MFIILLKNHSSFQMKIRLPLLLLSVGLAVFACQSSQIIQSQGFKTEEWPPFSTKFDSGQFTIAANGFLFNLRAKGLQNKGENLILLHGFPESSIMWDTLLAKADSAGYRVIAFDQRGYSPQARPSQIADYQLDKLSSDVLAIANALKFKKFHLVGHDWGAAVGWATVMKAPARIKSWSALSIPHLKTFFEAVLNDPEQQKRSAYFRFFQKPNEAEQAFLSNEQAGLKKMLANLPPHHLQTYLRIFAEPGAFTAALNWYRAMNIEKTVLDSRFTKPIICPTLFIWGTQDVVVNPAIIPQQKKLIIADYQELSLDCDHAIIQSKPQEVCKAILHRVKTANLSKSSTD
jgi:pimeloyl-ACP methyl ester carboxylesterase